MPILIALAIIVIVAIWLLPATALSGSSQPLNSVWSTLFRRKPCRWVQTGTTGENLRSFDCTTCKVTAYSTRPRGPQDCKRGLGGGL